MYLLPLLGVVVMNFNGGWGLVMIVRYYSLISFNLTLKERVALKNPDVNTIVPK